MTWRNPPSTSVTVICIVLLMAILAFVTASATVEKEPCMDDEQREHVRGIVLQGIEAGLQDQVKHVFTLWIKDDTEQPKRAITGMHAGIRAYVWARTAALKWDPPRCEEKPK